MIELMYIVRLIIGFIFLSSAIDKVKNSESHALTISKYKIIPSKLTRRFSLILGYCEFTLGVCLMTGVFQLQSMLIALTMLTVFNSAITLNLIKGNKNINCGCGGILGERKISWLLVLRNTVISILIILLIFNRTDIFGIDKLFFEKNENFHQTLEYVFLSLLAIPLTYNISNITNWISIKTYLKTNLKGTDSN